MQLARVAQAHARVGSPFAFELEALARAAEVSPDEESTKVTLAGNFLPLSFAGFLAAAKAPVDAISAAQSNSLPPATIEFFTSACDDRIGMGDMVSSWVFLGCPGNIIGSFVQNTHKKRPRLPKQRGARF